MSLRVWLPLNKNVIENKGLSDVTFSNEASASFNNSGIESCYNFSSTSGSGIYYGNPNNTFMDTYINHHSFSIGGWFKTSSDRTIGISLTYGVRLLLGDSSYTYFSLYNTSRIINCNANVAINNNKWHHVMGTYNISDNKMRIYIDGILKNTVSYTSGETYASSWNNALYIGRDPNNTTANSSYFYQGSLSDIRIYDHALSNKEVAELAKGLMFHLKLDNTDLYDCSGYGWDVSKYSGGTLSENSDTARYSKSLTFNNTYISHNACISNCDKITVACWAKPNNANLNNLYGFNYVGDWWQFTVTDSNCIGVRDNLGGYNGTRNDYSFGTIEANKWIHLVCSYNAGTVKIYKNGVLYSTNSTGGSTLNADITLGYIGQSQSNNRYYGSISDFRIYRTALTAQDIQDLYSLGALISA